MFKNMVVSWKTTLAGLLVGITLATPQLLNALDNNPETICDWKFVLAGFGTAIFGALTKDADKKSEDHETK